MNCRESFLFHHGFVTSRPSLGPYSPYIQGNRPLTTSLPTPPPPPPAASEAAAQRISNRALAKSHIKVQIPFKHHPPAGYFSNWINSDNKMMATPISRKAHFYTPTHTFFCPSFVLLLSVSCDTGKNNTVCGTTFKASGFSAGEFCQTNHEHRESHRQQRRWWEGVLAGRM